MLINEVNASGGIDGRKIEVVRYDTEGKPDRGASLFRRLAAEDGAVAVIGPDSIFVLLGMSSVPTEVKLMSVAGPGLYEMLKPEFRPYVASAWAANTFSGTLTLAYLKERFGANRVGMITTSDSIGLSIAETVKDMAGLFGMEVVAVESQPASDRDLMPSLRKLANVKPKIEALYVFGSGPFANVALNQAELAGVDVPIAYNGGNVVPALLKDISADAAKRTFLVTAPATVAGTLPKDNRFHDIVSKFTGDFEKKYGEAPTLPAAVGYDMAYAVVDAIRAVGPDREKIRDYIQSGQKFEGAQGVVFQRTPQDGYGTDPYDLVIAGIDKGGFVFQGNVSDAMQKMGVTREQLNQKMRDLKLILE